MDKLKNDAALKFSERVVSSKSTPDSAVSKSMLIKKILGTVPNATESNKNNRELSGSIWVKRYNGSKNIEDLEENFRKCVKKFIEALENTQIIEQDDKPKKGTDGKTKKAKYEIGSTFRPKERAYLMHWSFKVALLDFDVTKVPPMEGVAINWDHGDPKESKAAAKEMVDGYGFDKNLLSEKNLKSEKPTTPSPTTNHANRTAIDLAITWDENCKLKIKKADGVETTISSPPPNSTNPDLIDVAKGYGLIHYIHVEKDMNHWSLDGS